MMKKYPRRNIFFLFADIILIVLIFFAFRTCMNLEDNMCLNVYLGESHAGKSNIAQLFYAEDSKSFTSNYVITQVFEDNILSFDISDIDFGKNLLRLDPFNKKREFSISKIEIVIGKYTIFSVEGKKIKSYIDKTKSIKIKSTDDGLVCKSKNNNPRLFFKRDFSNAIYKYQFILNAGVYFIIAIFLVIFGIVQVKMLSGNDEKKSYKRYLSLFIFIQLLLMLGTALAYTLHYFEGHFGQVPFGQLVYHLHTPLDGTDVSSYRNVIILGVALDIALLIVGVIVYELLRKRHAHYGFVLWLGMISVILLAFSVYRGIIHFEVVEYYRYTHESTTIYDDHYVDGRDINLTFPERKRNLIYIFLESMEMSFSGQEYGGGMQDNLIPNLTEIAMDNECFSDGNGLNGAHHVSGATYTMGALAAQTCGVSINESIVSNEALNGIWDSENNYLPGVWAIGDVLKKQGYRQEFLIGSKGEFAGRSSYFRGHGDYLVEDYNKAKEEGRIPADYKVWWGYEDEKLFQFAKEDVKKLASGNEPFNFTMLTVDTHFTDGYKCDLCDDKYDTQYSNVIACSDGQVAEFIEWLQGQEFYDNTTIVICGDHLTPDSFYVNAQGIGSFDRRTYTAIINPAEGRKYSGNSRIYTTLDLYPTTLSAMGVTIDGDRLGLGVDLYSDTKTLAEEYGLEYLNTELLKNSKYYTEKLLYK